MINQIFLKSNSYCFTVLEQFDAVSWSFFFGHIQDDQNIYNDVIHSNILNYLSFIDICCFFLSIGFLIYYFINKVDFITHLWDNLILEVHFALYGVQTYALIKELPVLKLLLVLSEERLYFTEFLISIIVLLPTIIFNFIFQYLIIVFYAIRLVSNLFFLLVKAFLIHVKTKGNSFYTEKGFDVESFFFAFLSFFIIQLDKKEVSIHLPQTKAKSGLGFTFLGLFFWLLFYYFLCYCLFIIIFVIAFNIVFSLAITIFFFKSLSFFHFWSFIILFVCSLPMFTHIFKRPLTVLLTYNEKTIEKIPMFDPITGKMHRKRFRLMWLEEMGDIPVPEIKDSSYILSKNHLRF